MRRHGHLVALLVTLVVLLSRTAAAEEEPAPRQNVWVLGAVVGAGGMVSGATDERARGGVLGGLRVASSGIANVFAHRVDVEARAGGGGDGFVTRDRVGVWLGPAIALTEQKLTLRLGGEARYLFSEVVEYGRITAPALEVGLVHATPSSTGSGASAGSVVDVYALGGLAIASALSTRRADAESGLGAASGIGASVAFRRAVANVRYLATFARGFAGELDVQICGGAIFGVCIEGDHVVMDGPAGALSTWRMIASLGIGFGGIDR